jgi:hypothetical protein
MILQFNKKEENNNLEIFYKTSYLLFPTFPDSIEVLAGIALSITCDTIQTQHLHQEITHFQCKKYKTWKKNKNEIIRKFKNMKKWKENLFRKQTQELILLVDG